MKTYAEHFACSQSDLDVNPRRALVRVDLHNVAQLARRIVQSDFIERFSGFEAICDELPRARVREVLAGGRVAYGVRSPVTRPREVTGLLSPSQHRELVSCVSDSLFMGIRGVQRSQASNHVRKHMARTDWPDHMINASGRVAYCQII